MEGSKDDDGNDGQSREGAGNNHKKPDGSQGGLPAINETTARSPVKLELAGAVGNRGAVQAQGLGGRFGGGELDKAVAGVSGPCQ